MPTATLTSTAYPNLALTLGRPAFSPRIALGIVVLHAIAIAGLSWLSPAPEVAAVPLTVALIEAAPQPVATPRPIPVRQQPTPTPRPTPRPIAPPTTAPLMTTAATSSGPSNAPTAPAEASPPAAPAAQAAPAPVTPARFDADYLQNPAPAYPALSRRLREEGRVVLRVLVDASGRATQMEIRQSSSFPRLDDAAQEAVRRWKFIPARQGQDTVSAWVLVPIVFKLKD